jgi:hypothetical protein
MEIIDHYAKFGIDPLIPLEICDVPDDRISGLTQKKNNLLALLHFQT